MKLLHKLIELLAILVLILIGTLSISVAYSVERWDPFIQLAGAGQSRFILLFGGVATLFIALLFFLSAIPGKKREQFLSIDKDGGTVSISTSAIADYISKLVDEFPSIVRMTSEIIPQRRSIDVLVKVNVKASPQIHEACELLQQRIRETLINGLGIPDVRHIEVSVRQIVSEHLPG